MGSIQQGFAKTFRDFKVEGVPSSGAHDPEKPDIRALALLIEAAVAAAATSGTNLDQAAQLISQLLISAQASQAAAEAANRTLARAFQAIPASVAAQLDAAVAEATTAAAASRDSAQLAAQTALASSRYYPTVAAGEAATPVDQAFTTSDANGNLIYYRRTSGGSTEISRALTIASLPVVIVDLWPSVAAAYTYVKSRGGGTMVFGRKRYDHPWTSEANRIADPNIRIIGAGRPTVSANGNRLVDGSGTIFNGPFHFWADNLHLEGFGVDSGADVCAGLYGGAAQEGIISAKPGQDPWDKVNSPNKSGLTVRNVGALLQSPGAPVHAALFEAYDHADIEDVEVRNGLHGFVGKLRFSNIRGVKAKGQAGGNPGEGEGFLLKGNNYAPLDGVTATGVVVEGGAFPNDNGIGVQILSESSSGAGSVQISGVVVVGKNKGVDLAGTNLVDCTITGVKVDSTPFPVNFGGGIKRCRVSNATLNNSTLAVRVFGAGDMSNSFADSCITNVSGRAGVDIDTSKLAVDNIHFENVLASGSSCVRVDPATGRARVGRLTWKQGTILVPVNSTPTLVNAWTEAGGDDPPFLVLYMDGCLKISGAIKSGSSDTFANGPAWLNPSSNRYFLATLADGTTRRGIWQKNGDIRIIARPASGEYVFIDNVTISDVFLPR